MDDLDIAIVTVSDACFLPAACCQLVSTSEHLSESDSDRAQLFLVICDVTDEDVVNAERFFEERSISVEIVVPDFTDRMISPIEARWPRAAYLRLYFDWIFDQRWRRIVYFDADTRVCAPLLPLLTADLLGQPFGAAHDSILYISGNIHRFRRSLLLAEDAPYFQSGVMVFDWPAMLACDGLAAARRFIVEHSEACFEAPDQNALNAVFENRWTPLDPRWNMHELYLQFGHRFEPRIMHFTSIKPWSRRRPRIWREAAAWYQAVLVDSAWSGFVESQSAWESLRADMGASWRRYSPYLQELLLRYAPSLVRRLGWEYKAGHLPWVPRRRSDVEEITAALILEAEGRCPPLRPPEAALKHGHW